MKKFKRGILFIVYLLFWIVAFESMRLFFMLFNFANGFSCPVPEFFGALWHGLSLDMAMMAYIGIFVVPFFIAFSFVKSQRAFKILMDVLTLILLIVGSLIVVGDAEVYRSWQFRIDASVLQYLSNPSSRLVLSILNCWLTLLRSSSTFLVLSVMRSFRRFSSEQSFEPDIS